MRQIVITNVAEAKIRETWTFQVPEGIEIPEGLTPEELWDFLTDDQPEIDVNCEDYVIGFEEDRREFEMQIGDES